MFFNLKRKNIFKRSRILHNAISKLDSTYRRKTVTIDDFIKLDEYKRTDIIREIGDDHLIEWMGKFFLKGWWPSVDLLFQMKYSAGHLPLVRYLNTVNYFSDIRLNTFASMLLYKEYNCHTLTLPLDYFLNVVKGKASNIIAIPLNGIVGYFAPHTFNYSEGCIIDALMGMREGNFLNAQSRELNSFKEGGYLSEWYIYENIEKGCKTLNGKKMAKFLGKQGSGAFITIDSEAYEKLEAKDKTAMKNIGNIRAAINDHPTFCSPGWQILG